MIRIGILWLILVLASGASGRAEPVQLVTLSYPPYEYDNGGQAEGIAVRLVRHAFNRLGRDVTIEVLPWKRALLMVQEGQADGIFTAFVTPERLNYLDYSNVVLMPQTVSIWARRDAAIRFDGNLQSVAYNNIGLVNGISYGTTVDEAVKQGVFNNIDYAVSQDRNITKLLLKRLDLVIMNRYSARYHLIRQKGLDQVEELSPPLQDVPSYIAFSKKRNLTGLRDRFDETLRQMIDSGRYDAIIEGYFEEIEVGTL